MVYIIIGVSLNNHFFNLVYNKSMTSTSEWRKWLLQQLIGEGVHKVVLEDQIHEEAGRHYDTNLDLALRSLRDEGIIMSLESDRKKKYVVNYDKLDEAQQIINSEPREDTENILVQPYIHEPEGYVYWFDNKENRKFKKQNIYNIYFKKTDRMAFAAQLITKSMGNPKIIHMGSLNESDSYISKLWLAAFTIAQESRDGTFILQNLQDKERMACGNNRQRGKIAIAIFRKLGYIQQVEIKGNSTKFKLSGRKPFPITLDEIFNSSTYNKSYIKI
jgi:hypothetical protein